MQQAGRVGRPQLQHGRVGGRAVEPEHPRRLPAGPEPYAASFAASRSASGSEPASALATSARSSAGSGPCAEPRADREHVHRGRPDRHRAGRPHVQLVQGQHPGRPAEQAGPVRRGHRDRVAVHPHRHLARRWTTASSRCAAVSTGGGCGGGRPATAASRARSTSSATRSAFQSRPGRRPGGQRVGDRPARAAGRAGRGEPSTASATVRRSPGRPGRGGSPCPAAAGGAGPSPRSWRRPPYGEAQARAELARRPRRRRRCGRRASPCRCRAAARRAAAGPAGPPSRVSAAASAAASTRCRSTVKRCTGLCCGVQRTARPLRDSRTSSPAWSSASSTGTARWPVPSRATNASRAGGRPRRGSGGDSVASRSSACGASGRSAPGGGAGRRAAPARVGPRVGVAGQHDLAVLLDHVRRRAAGAARPGARRPAAPGSAPVRRRPASSPSTAARRVGGVGDRPRGVGDRAQQVVVAGPSRARRRRRPAPARPAGPAPGRPARCSSPRASSRTSRAARDRRPGQVEQLGRGEPCSACTSRRPPRASLRSGSSRKASSPAVRQRAARPRAAPAAGAGAVCRQAAYAPLAQLGGQRRVAGEVPSVEQAERGLEVVPGDGERLGDRAHGVVEADAGVPDRVPDRVGDRADVGPCRRAAAPGRGRCTAPARAGPARRPRPGPPPVPRRASSSASQPSYSVGRARCRSGRPDQRRVRAGRTCTEPGRRSRRRSTQSASRPRSPVRTRTTSSTGVTQTLPSPILPVRAASTMASTTLSASLVVDQDLDPDLGHEVDRVLGAPVDLGVAPLPAVAAGPR